MNNKGFTLIELLVVVAILGIVVAIIIASLDPDYERKIKRTELCEEKKIDCRFDCSDNDNKKDMDLCLSKCDIAFDKCNYKR